MNDLIYERIKKRYEEVYVVTPNDLHFSFLTDLFKLSTSSLKSFPFKVILPLSFISTVGMYLLLGMLTARLVSLLQHGF